MKRLITKVSIRREVARYSTHKRTLAHFLLYYISRQITSSDGWGKILGLGVIRKIGFMNFIVDPPLVRARSY